MAPLSSWINLAEEAEYRGRRADILVNRELAGHRGAAVAEPAFIAGPSVDARSRFSPAGNSRTPAHREGAIAKRGYVRPHNKYTTGEGKAPEACEPGASCRYHRASRHCLMECGGKRSATPLWISTEAGLPGTESQSAVAAALCRRTYSSSKVIHGWRGESFGNSPQPTVNNFGGDAKMLHERLLFLLNREVGHAGPGRRIPHSNPTSRIRPQRAKSF